jgi:uncharacterized membrane protein
MTRIGRQFGGLAAMALGGVMVWWGDFTSPWHKVPIEGPLRNVLVYATAAAFIVGGAAFVFRRTARPAALVLIALYAAFALLRIPIILKAPQIYDTWGTFAELLSIVAGYLGAYACLMPRESAAAAERLALAARICFGVCSISFGVVHFVYLKSCAGFVPAWVPLGGVFWSLATGVAHLAAAVAILSGVWAVPAARLASIMYLGFGVIAWGAYAQAHPAEHFSWSGEVITFVLAAAAWMISDALAQFPSKDGQLFLPRAQAA